MPDDAQEMAFPLSGVDVSCEVDRQTPRTTPRGVNVRACDPGSLRWRGAARAGLTKLIDATVSGGVGFPVQHLNAIVDPTIEALLANFPEVMSPPGNSIPDPSTNNAAGGSTDPDNPLVRNPDREIRDGGSGIQPNRKLPPRPGIQFVQKAEGYAFVPAPNQAADATFAATPVSGRMVIVGVWSSTSDAADFNTVHTVTNGAGAAYAQIGGAFNYVTANNGVTDEVRLSLWWRVATGVAADATVHAATTFTGAAVSEELLVGALEYSGVHSSGPTANAANTAITPTTLTPTAGSVALNGSTGQMVVAAFLTGYIFGTVQAWTPGTGYTARFGAPDLYAMLTDRIGLTGFGTQTPGITESTTPVLQGGICAAFKKA